MSHARPFKGHPACQEPDGGDPCPQFTDLLNAYDEMRTGKEIAQLRADKAELLAALSGLVDAIDVPDNHGAIDYEWHEAFEKSCSLIAKHEAKPCPKP